jgi:hypothetical protein
MGRDEKIIEMYNSNINATKIAKELNIGRRTIYRVLEKYDIPLRKTKIKKCLVCSKECQKNLCGTCNTNLRRYRVKKQSVEYLGGECNRCGWVGHLSGYDFHHQDPTEKDFSPSARELANKSWEIAKKELDKCELLCALCHRKEHSSYGLLEDISKTYTGKEFKDR